jgi:hypothetical protein
MSKAEKDAVKKMKPSAYRSMLMGKLNMTEKTPKKTKDLKRWKDEKWLNLTSTFITDKDKEYACGTKGKKQKDKGLKSVCRPKKKVNKNTPQPLAYDLSEKQIRKAIKIKNEGKRIKNWSKL